MIVVVEGKHDASLISSIFPEAYVLITNGSEVPNEVIEEIKSLSKKDKVYLCFDPDGPGNKIRNKILNEVSDVLNVYADKNKAISKNGKKVGIEHMTKDLLVGKRHLTKDEILKLFQNAYEYKETKNFDYITIYKLGLADSKKKRAELCMKLNLGYCNAKQLVKRLNMHGITLKEVEEKL